jgi:hypothetical protein
VNINHNFIVNIGSELFIFLVLQIPILVVLIWRRSAIFERIKRIEEILITLFFCRTLFSCVLSFIGLGLNIGMVTDATFVGSQVVAFIFFIVYLSYFVVRVRQARSLQLYKLNILLLVIILPFLNRLVLPCLFFINLVEVVFFCLDYYFYRGQKTNQYVYIVERVLMLAAYNVAVVVTSLIPLLVILCLTVVGLIGIKSWVFY